MKIQKLKENKGFTGQDILIAIFITMLFLSFITTMIINLSNTNYEIEKTRQVTELLSKIADKIDQMGYDDLEATVDEKDISEINELKDYEIPKNVNIKYTVSTEGSNEQTTKNIKLIAQYSTTKNSNKVDLIVKKQKSKQQTGSGNNGEILDSSSDKVYQYPFNIPETNGYYNNEKIIPVKFIWTNPYEKKGYWVTTTEDDPEWYSIEEGIYPTYVSENTPTRNKMLTLVNQNYTMKNYTVLAQNVRNIRFYLWIPRIAGNTRNYGYAVGTTNYKYILKSGKGYIAEQPESTEYNARIFPSDSKGILLQYTTNNKFWNDTNYNGLPNNMKTELAKFKDYNGKAKNSRY